MIVYGFVGASGTGKSALALSLCHRLNIHDFIDDGLYIHNGVKVAGKSAKYEQNRVAAVKRAIFLDPCHRDEVRSEIQRKKPKKILIIGTSKKMVRRIAEALNLPAPTHWLFIEQISTPEDIQKAKFAREMYGQHVIPIPHIQVENDRFFQLIEKVKSVFDNNAKPLGENTIVYPRFQGGKILIRRSCLKKIILYTLKSNEHIALVKAINVSLDLNEPIQLEVGLYDRKPIPDVCQEIQQQVQEIITQMLCLSIPSPSIYVTHLKVTGKERGFKE
ncbi:adenylate kinase family enzyme [Caldalkalibacillus uzonensis]|uniref:Adenylate kinase family enzyme n=1 Tax=Caldalkalibacillus uzonensis TaxID=353224 RepID=A0ABU0CP71_9BACI|nr:hypothetical protein [Caldalkalibacillus uzonensis]MDQ0338210.1 adenylate kinase family enzyme [Caldalkalibacillus uzonensis]